MVCRRYDMRSSAMVCGRYDMRSSTMVCGRYDMRSSAMVCGRPCLAIKSAILYDAVSPVALLHSMRNPFNFDDEKQTLSLRASTFSFGLFTIGDDIFLRCKESLE